MRDLMNTLTPKPVIAPQAAFTGNTARVGSIIDHRGFDSAMYSIHAGALDSGSPTMFFTVLLEEGDDASLSDAAAVADDDLIGTEALASFTGADSNKCFKLGYRGSKRYTRLTITPSGNTTSSNYFSAECMLGHADAEPTANPPA